MTESLLPPESALNRLVQRISASDRNALRILFLLLCEPVRDRVRRALPGKDDVRAVVDATFVEVWWMARYHLAPGDVAAWVCGIAARRTAERLLVPGEILGDEASRLTLARLLDQPVAYATVSPGL